MKIDNFQLENDLLKHRKMVKENEEEFRHYQMSGAEAALDRMHTLMEMGYQEHKA